MSLTRRSFLGGGAAALGLLGISSLTGCSTTPTSRTSASPAAGGSGAPIDMVLWMWPDGFGKATLAAVAAKFPHLRVRQDVIGGDFKQKLTATFTAKSGLPDVTGVKGEDIAFFLSHPEFFVDLNTLGAADKKSEYLDWKWQQGSTPDGKLIGFPIDIGPTALFYRHDIFHKAGLPFEPDELAASIRTWDEYYELGKKLKSALPDTYLIRNGVGLFKVIWPQSGKGFIDEKGVFIGDGDHMKAAWDKTVKAVEAGIVAGVQSDTSDSAAGVSQGKFPADFGASWHLADLMNDAKSTAGKWHVCAHPGAPTNDGGSFLTIPKGVKDPARSFELISFILNPENQALEYADKGNFPSTPASYTMSQLTGPVDFLGGQVASTVFGEAAKTVRPLFEHPQSSAVSAPYAAEMKLFEAKKKSADQAFADAVSAAKRIAQQSGVTVH